MEPHGTGNATSELNPSTDARAEEFVMLPQRSYRGKWPAKLFRLRRLRSLPAGAAQSPLSGVDSAIERLGIMSNWLARAHSPAASMIDCSDNSNQPKGMGH